MFKPNIHKDWYQDGDFDLMVWRLDIADWVQVQLNALELDDGLYSARYLFIERDRRDESGDVRIDYACHSWSLSDEFAQRLLESSEQGVVELLSQELEFLLKLPCDDRYCGTSDEQRQKVYQ